MTKKNKGFTLIEIIVILVVAGIMAAILVPFMGTALTRSHEPLDNLRHSADLSSDMARVVAEWDGIWESVYDKCEEEDDYQDFLDCVDEELEDEIQATITFENSNINQIGLFRFDEDNNQYNEVSCGSPGNWSGCELIKVRLAGKDNPGETLTYYFSSFSQYVPEEDDYVENDPRGCNNLIGGGQICTDLKPGWVCLEYHGQSSNCTRWVYQP